MKIDFAPGAYDICINEYHSSSGISRSMLMDFHELPMKYWYKHLSGQYIKEEKEAWNIGSMVHTLALEPHTFNDSFLVITGLSRATKIGKDEYADALERAEGRIIVKQKDYEEAKRMADAVRENATCTSIISDAIIEQSIYWEDPDTGILCKVRPDIRKAGVIADLKTTADAGYFAFQRSAYKYGYYLQAGMIYEGLRQTGIADMQAFVFPSHDPILRVF